MALNLSVRELVILIISIFVVIFGFLLVLDVIALRDVIDSLPGPEVDVKLETPVKVFPESSQIGTVFSIVIDYPELRYEQDLDLVLINGEYKKRVQLYDDGRHFDRRPGDGVYGGIFDSIDAPLGTYEISLPSELTMGVGGGEILATFLIYEPNCEVIKGDAKESDIDFVILPSGYENYNEFKFDALSIMNGKDSIFEIEPFFTRRNDFTVSIIRTPRDLGCETDCGGTSTIICCDNKEVFKEASQCHYDSVMVLVNSNKDCGSASTYAKTCAKQSEAKLSLAHEVGHSFGGLADEYVYNNYYIGKIDSPNCAEEPKCGKWGHITDECVSGCTYPELYRPSENSLMSEFVPYFNLVSELHINKVIRDHAILEIGDKTLPEKGSYFVNIEYNRGEIEIKDFSIKPIKAPIESKPTPYTVEVRDNNENIISESKFALPTLIVPGPGDDVPLRMDEFEYPIIVPFSPEAETLEIKENGVGVAKSFVQVFSKTCGNMRCDESENNLNCPLDCSLEGDSFCQSDVCDPDCPGFESCESREDREFGYAIVLIIASLTVIAVVFLRKRHSLDL